MKKSTLLILYCWSLIYLQLFTFPSHQVRLVCKGLRTEAGGWRLEAVWDKGQGSQELCCPHSSFSRLRLMTACSRFCINAEEVGLDHQPAYWFPRSDCDAAYTAVVPPY